jgi:L-2-hydroxyglutarate oxidase LhgO
VDKVDVMVIGAGVVGLAVARSLSMVGRSVVVIERHAYAGMETSSRNSGVIHSGIYYAPGSAKAILCVRGRELLYEYCRARQVPYRQCGKLIVAQRSEESRLESVQATALKNGVTDLAWLDQAGVREKEAAIRASAGLWCPRTGIISVHEFMSALHGDVENAGGNVVFRTEFIAAHAVSQGFAVTVLCQGELSTIACECLINSAGLAATTVLSRIDGYPAGRIPRQYFAKGNYFEYTRHSPFQHLVYPMPGEGGLGVHATLDIAGRLRFGPDVEWLQEIVGDVDYAVRPERGERFYAAIREYWPELPDNGLSASYSGIRPKLVGPGSVPADFLVEGPADHEVPGLINLLGIESPGLTSALALGEQVEHLLA